MKKGSTHGWDTIIKLKRAKMNKNSYLWILCNENKYEITDNLTQWSKMKGLSKGSLYEVAIEKRKHYKNWTVKRYDITQLTEKQITTLEKLLTKHNKDLLGKLEHWNPYAKEKLTKAYNAYVEEKAIEPETYVDKNTQNRHNVVEENTRSETMPTQSVPTFDFSSLRKLYCFPKSS